MKKTLKYIESLKISVSEADTLRAIANEFWNKADKSINLTEKMKDEYVKQRVKDFIQRSLSK